MIVPVQFHVEPFVTVGDTCVFACRNVVYMVHLRVGALQVGISHALAVAKGGLCSHVPVVVGKGERPSEFALHVPCAQSVEVHRHRRIGAKVCTVPAFGGEGVELCTGADRSLQRASCLLAVGSVAYLQVGLVGRFQVLVAQGHMGGRCLVLACLQLVDRWLCRSSVQGDAQVLPAVPVVAVFHTWCKVHVRTLVVTPVVVVVGVILRVGQQVHTQ